MLEEAERLKLMNKEEFKEKIKTIKNGRFTKLLKVTEISGKGNTITKETQMVVRFGVKYTHIKGNENKKNDLPWGQWVDNYIISHNGVDYVRVTATNSKGNHKVKYYCNGEEINQETAVSMVGSKALSKPSQVYNIKLENVVKIG